MITYQNVLSLKMISSCRNLKEMNQWIQSKILLFLVIQFPQYQVNHDLQQWWIHLHQIFGVCFLIFFYVKSINWGNVCGQFCENEDQLKIHFVLHEEMRIPEVNNNVIPILKLTTNILVLKERFLKFIVQIILIVIFLLLLRLQSQMHPSN